MPIYDYKCLVCGEIKEVMHTIAEIENPSESTIKKITCNCNDEGVRMVKIFSAICVKTPTKTAFLNVDRKKRNHNHFVKEVLPSVDKDTRNHHLKKMGKNL